MRQVKVPLGERSYQIDIGSGNLSRIALRIRDLGLKGKFLIVTNTKVEPLYGELISEALKEEGFSVHKIVLPDGENYKNLDSAVRIYDQAIAAGLDRYSCIIALGGGVVGDLAGFAAATYMRGINFIQVPTTLLAQVDASVGGKVAVNHSKGKNIIGAFYQPKLVLIDVATLNTLPPGEIRSGLAEVIKYGIISDQNLFSDLEEHLFHSLMAESRYWMDIVEKSCRIKAQVVSRDEMEQDYRAILNFGHTIGHGLEGATSYQNFRHGEAVAIGMVGAAYIAREMGLISLPEVERIKNLISKTGLPISFSGIKWDELWLNMQRDKKAQDGNIKFILPTSIGSVIITPVDPILIRKVVEQELIK
ncbi:MAG: 3-dehydroquinate synthase [Bacillota bacterium]|jgi:3-dehydroquinate synthase